MQEQTKMAQEAQLYGVWRSNSLPLLETEVLKDEMVTCPKGHFKTAVK